MAEFVHPFVSRKQGLANGLRATRVLVSVSRQTKSAAEEKLDFISDSSPHLLPAAPPSVGAISLWLSDKAGHPQKLSSEFSRTSPLWPLGQFIVVVSIVIKMQMCKMV